MPPVLLIDPTELALMPILASREEIMQVNLQRFEMIQLDGIVLLDPSRHTIGGYKDVGNGEFWVRGHMPGYPLLPGVLICEAAAQLCSYYHKVCIRFRLPVRPGQRLYLIAKGIKIHRRQVTFDVQGYVGSQLAFHGIIIGIAMHREQPPSIAGGSGL